MLDEDASDAEDLGSVGFMNDTLTTQHPFWRIVCNLHFPPSEVDGWTLGEMRIATAYLDMQGDYKRAWSSMYDLRRTGKE